MTKIPIYFFDYDLINISYCNFNRRAIMTGRAVRVNSQLKSHKRFANAFPKYCKLVDKARLFSTNGVGVPPKVKHFFFFVIDYKFHDGNFSFHTKNSLLDGKMVITIY
jgi:hypothetical protein